MTSNTHPFLHTHGAAALALCCLLVCALAHAQPKVAAVSKKAPAAEAQVTTLDELLARLAHLQDMSARYQEEKRIALLKRPLRSEGRIAFAAPNLLLRRTESPEQATMLLVGNVLRIADASGSRRIDLQESSIVRHFVMTFMYILSGDRAALDRLYTLHFELAADGSWRLDLTPKQPELARVIRHATLLGRGIVVEQMTIDEPTGDATVMRFSDVKLDQHYAAAERARLFRLPAN